MMATPVGMFMVLKLVTVQTRLVTPAAPVKTGFVSVRKFTPWVRNVAVTFGLGLKMPFVSVMKLVMLMVPAAIVNGNWNDGVCAKDVVFVAGPPPPPAAGLMDMAPMANCWPSTGLQAQVLVTSGVPAFTLLPPAS